MPRLYYDSHNKITTENGLSVQCFLHPIPSVKLEFLSFREPAQLGKINASVIRARIISRAVRPAHDVVSIKKRIVYARLTMERFAAAKTFASMSSLGPNLFDISRKLPERIGA